MAVFEQYSHEPYLAVVRFWVTYASDPPPAAEIEARRADGYKTLDALENHLATRRYLVADGLTIVDIALYAYTDVAHEGRFDLSGYSAIRRWLDRVAAEDGHVPMSQPHG